MRRRPISPYRTSPLGVFRASDGRARPGVAIGDQILDLAAAVESKLLETHEAQLVEACVEEGALNPLARGGGGADAGTAGGAEPHAARRHGAGAQRTGARDIAARAIVRRRAARARHGSATTPTSTRPSTTRRTWGACSGPITPLLPNYKWVPDRYHGRASSIIPSGQHGAVDRPARRARAAGAADVWPEPAPRLRARGRRRNRTGQCARRPHLDRRGRRAHRRPLPRERLVGARHPDVGVPATRTVPREELRDDHLTVARDARCARAIPRAAARHARRPIRRRSRISPTRPITHRADSGSSSPCGSRARECERRGESHSS